MVGQNSPFLKQTVEKGVSEYEKMIDELEEFFFDLEKIKPIDLTTIYIILPPESRMKKKSLLWGFSIADKCGSKVFIVTKRTEKMEKEIEKLSKAMGVEFEFLEGAIPQLLREIEKESNLVILPRDTVESMKGEKRKNPLLII